MNPYLTELIVGAHRAELTEQARQSRLAHDARTSARYPGRLRASTARLLVAIAARLDDRLQPTPAIPSMAGGPA